MVFRIFGSTLESMLVRDLFNPTGVSQSFSGLTVFLDHNNCQIINKTRQDKAVLLHLRRESDRVEGRAYMRVKKEYLELQGQLLNWAFNEPRIVGLTVNELNYWNVPLISVDGRLQLN